MKGFSMRLLLLSFIAMFSIACNSDEETTISGVVSKGPL